jgi:hypothetical protein
MIFGEDYLALLGQIDNFTEEVTGVSVIDAYFGPKNLSPEKAKMRLTPEKLLLNLDVLIEKAKEIVDELRRIAVTSDLESLQVVVKWLLGEDIPYTRLVEEIFGITPRKFWQNEIRKAQKVVEDACATLTGADVSEKVLKWREESKISGRALKKMIGTAIAERTKEITGLFEKHVFAHFPTKVENKGVIYKTVTGEPWGAYNYYQGDYTSINAFNIDRSFNRYRLIMALCHEYEHHAANLLTEMYYRENKSLDLSAVLLNTKRCVISEGTADCARDFIGLQLSEEYGEFIESLNNLEKMIGLNVAYMLNVENVDDETAAEYLASEGFLPIEEAKKQIVFSKPLTPDGRPNFFKPYIYTYFFGRRDYVLPTFQKAQRKGKVQEFLHTLYLNPYSRSSATWKIAFSKI